MNFFVFLISLLVFIKVGIAETNGNNPRGVLDIAVSTDFEYLLSDADGKRFGYDFSKKKVVNDDKERCKWCYTIGDNTEGSANVIMLNAQNQTYRIKIVANKKTQDKISITAISVNDIKSSWNGLSYQWVQQKVYANGETVELLIKVSNIESTTKLLLEVTDKTGNSIKESQMIIRKYYGEGKKSKIIKEIKY